MLAWDWRRRDWRHQEGRRGDMARGVMEVGTIGLQTIGVSEGTEPTIRLLCSLSWRLIPLAGSEVRSDLKNQNI